MKLMLGRPGQGAWQGGGRAASCLALAEGFETARAFTLIQGAPCWASLGARRLDQILLPQGLTSLILAVDNDAEGELAAARAALRYARPGLEITWMAPLGVKDWRSEEHTSELQSLMRISYAVFCLKKNKKTS